VPEGASDCLRNLLIASPETAALRWFPRRDRDLQLLERAGPIDTESRGERESDDVSLKKEQRLSLLSLLRSRS